MPIIHIRMPATSQARSYSHLQAPVFLSDTRMVALVKTCKTFRLSNRLAWKDIKTKVEGVEFLDERRAIMVFHKPASKTMTLLGSNHIDVVKTCSVYDGVDGDDGNGDDEAATLRAVIKASGMGTTYITALAMTSACFG